MQQTLLTLLRDQNTEISLFRECAHKLSTILAGRVAELLPKETCTVTTPLGSAEGRRLSGEVILIPVLRAGLAMLPPFMQFFPAAKVGFVGLRRDEATAIAYQYYDNLPLINKEDQVIILDPMLATGGSALKTVELLMQRGVSGQQIIYSGIIACPEGISLLSQYTPQTRIVTAHVDQCLDENKYIVPGLGDFGDRYFGTE